MDVAWTVPALADLDHIQDFIAQDSPVAAFRLTADLMRRTDSLLSVHATVGRLGRVRGTALTAPLAELDSLLVYELQLESRLSEVLNRSMPVAAR